MVGRKPPDEFPLFWFVRIAVFRHPRSAGQQLIIPAHVEQRHLTDGGLHQVRIQSDHVADQQSAIGSALDSEAARRGDLAGKKIAGDRRKVFIGTQTVRLESALVPARAVFSAAANVSHHINSSLRRPGAAHPGAVGRLQRDFKAAIAIKERRMRAVSRHTLTRDHEIRHAGAVVTGGKMLRDLQTGRIKKCRHRLQFFRGLADLAERKCGRREVIGGGQKIRVRFIGIDRHDPDCADGWRSHQRDRFPVGRAPVNDIKTVFHVLQHIQIQEVTGKPAPRQRGIGGRFKNDAELAPAGHKVIETRDQQRACLVGLAPQRPVVAQLHTHPFVENVGARRVRHIDSGELQPGIEQVQFAVVKGEGAADQIAFESRGVIVNGRH